MPRIPITGSLLADLLTAARAHGARIIDVAVVIETPNTLLLLHQGDGDDFSPHRWDLPTATARHPRDQLGDAIRRAVTGTAGYDVADITGYLGHHDDTVGGTSRRTFGFTVTVTDPARMHRDARRGHQWLLTWRNPLRFPDATTPLARHLTSAALRRPGATPARTRNRRRAAGRRCRALPAGGRLRAAHRHQLAAPRRLRLLHPRRHLDHRRRHRARRDRLAGRHHRPRDRAAALQRRGEPHAARGSQHRRRHPRRPPVRAQQPGPGQHQPHRPRRPPRQRPAPRRLLTT